MGCKLETCFPKVFSNTSNKECIMIRHHAHIVSCCEICGRVEWKESLLLVSYVYMRPLWQMYYWFLHRGIFQYQALPAYTNAQHGTNSTTAQHNLLLLLSFILLFLLSSFYYFDYYYYYNIHRVHIIVLFYLLLIGQKKDLRADMH